MIQGMNGPAPAVVGGAVADILACPPRSDYDIPGMDEDGGGGVDGERTGRSPVTYLLVNKHSPPMMIKRAQNPEEFQSIEQAQK